MTGFDPAAAADAYVQRLPAEALAVAPAQTIWSETLLVASLAVALLAAVTVVRSGVLARIQDRMAAADRPEWMADAASGGAAAGLIALALVLLAPIAAGHPGGHASSLPLALVAAVRQAAVLGLVGALFAPPLYALMRRLPRLWAPALGSVAAVLVFAAVWLPFAAASGPANLPAAPPGSARDGLMQLIAETRLGASDVYVSSDPGFDADVTGLGATRIVVSGGLWRSASPEELRASVGHLMGHYAHHDQLSIALLLAVLALGLFPAIRYLTAPAARLMGLKDAEGPADAMAAPALIAVAIAYLSLAVVADHAFIRWINVRADQYSLDHARAPDGLAQALLQEWKGEAVDPSPLQETLFYDHPPLRSRLLHAMRWKAAHSLTPLTPAPSPG
jgi:STE24 endopeptidase